MADELKQCKADIERLNLELAELQDAGRQDEQGNDLAGLSDNAFKQGEYFPIKLQKTLKGHFGKVYAMDWGSRDSKKLLSASQDGKLIVWNALNTNKVDAVPLSSSWVMTCALSPDDTTAASGGLDNLCTIYQLGGDGKETRKRSVQLAQHQGYLSSCKYVGTNKILTASGDSTCILWDIELEAPEGGFIGHEQDVMSVSTVESNPNLFVSGSVDQTVRVWDMRLSGASDKKNCVNTFRGHESDVNAVAWFPDGNAVVSGSDDCTCRLWDLRANKRIGIYQSNKMLHPVTSIDMSKSGKFIFAGTDSSSCYVWDALAGKNVGVTPNFQHSDDQNQPRVSCLGVSPGGQVMATGNWDSTIRIWSCNHAKRG